MNPHTDLHVYTDAWDLTDKIPLEFKRFDDGPPPLFPNPIRLVVGSEGRNDINGAVEFDRVVAIDVSESLCTIEHLRPSFLLVGEKPSECTLRGKRIRVESCG